MDDVVVFCTKNRPADLRSALTSIAGCKMKPNAVAVVDGGIGLEVDDLRRIFEKTAIEFLYLRSDDFGLVRARNVALSALHSEYDIIHFFDDDVIVHPEYFNTINPIFESHDVVGAGGFVEAKIMPRSNWLFVLLGIHSRNDGVVLKNGFSFGSTFRSGLHEVEWLPGCAMSFNLDKIKDLKFDVRRANYPIGEDVDFGLRASKLGKMIHAGSAKIFHNLSAVNRISQSNWVRQDVWHRSRLAFDKLGRVSFAHVCTSTLLFGFIHIIAGMLYFDRDKLSIGRAALHGLADVCLRSVDLVKK